MCLVSLPGRVADSARAAPKDVVIESEFYDDQICGLWYQIGHASGDVARSGGWDGPVEQIVPGVWEGLVHPLEDPGHPAVAWIHDTVPSRNAATQSHHSQRLPCQ